jgi:hypothetical protein
MSKHSEKPITLAKKLLPMELKNLLALFLVLAGSGVILMNCFLDSKEEEPSTSSCETGESTDCTCLNGNQGTQVCGDNGEYGACVCPECLPDETDSCTCTDGKSGARACGPDSLFAECICHECLPGVRDSCTCSGGEDGVQDCGADSMYLACVCVECLFNLDCGAGEMCLDSSCQSDFSTVPQSLYEDTLYGISFNYPEYWDMDLSSYVSESDTLNEAQPVSFDIWQDTLYGSFALRVQWPLPAASDPDSLKLRLEDDIIRDFNGTADGPATTITIAGQTAASITFTWVSNVYELRSMIVYVVFQNKLYGLHYVTYQDRFENHLIELDSIVLNSIVFTEGCTEGDTAACTCYSGSSGSQTCDNTGFFGPCYCSGVDTVTQYRNETFGISFDIPVGWSMATYDTVQLSGDYHYAYVGDLLREDSLYQGQMEVHVRLPVPDGYTVDSLLDEVNNYIAIYYQYDIPLITSSSTDTIGTYAWAISSFSTMSDISGQVGMTQDSTKTLFMSFRTSSEDYPVLITDIDSTLTPSVELFPGTYP